MATGIYRTFLRAERDKEKQRAAGAERSCWQGERIFRVAVRGVQIPDVLVPDALAVMILKH